MNAYFWNDVKTVGLPNLKVLTRNGIEVGFVYKPTDTASDKNAWRCHLGIGDRNQFLGHAWALRAAQEKVLAAA